MEVLDNLGLKTRPIDGGNTGMPYELKEIPVSDIPPWIREESTLRGVIEYNDFKGGSYGDLKEAGYGWPDQEVHHMPADSASELPRNDGPAIVMDYEDHRKTASCGSSREAYEYRMAQKALIEQGKFDEAMQMDIDDIHEKFGDKYDNAIAEAQAYAKKLKEEERV